MPNYLSLNSSDYELRQTAFSSNNIQGKAESSKDDLSVFAKEKNLKMPKKNRDFSEKPGMA